MSKAPDARTDLADILLHLSRRARQAEAIAELRFIAVNETRALVHFRQAALWLSRNKQLSLSGVVAPEANAPYAQWLQRVFRSLATAAAGKPTLVTSGMLDPEDAAEWEEWLPAQAVWVPFGSRDGDSGGLFLARDEAWDAVELRLLEEWRDIWWHAFDALDRQAERRNWLRRFGSTAAASSRVTAAPDAAEGGEGTGMNRIVVSVWQSPWKRFGLLALVVALFPVRLTVLPPGELVPKDPSAIRSPIEGTVDRFSVTPNQRVKKGQPLLQLDLTALRSRHSVAMQELATADAEYRQSAQQAVFDPRSKAQLAALQGRIAERRTEVAFLESQLTRAQIVAPRDGVVLVDDPSELIGKPVVTGEKLMTIADEFDVEIEAWLSPGDLIDLPPNTRVKLYLNADPLHPVAGTLLYVAHEAVARPDGSYAYRLRARPEPDQPRRRVGLKGTARVAGRHVPLIYWVLRRPLAILRPYLGI